MITSKEGFAPLEADAATFARPVSLPRAEPRGSAASPGKSCAPRGIARSASHGARDLCSAILQVSSRAYCELSLPDSKRQMVLFTQEIRLFIFQSHQPL